MAKVLIVDDDKLMCEILSTCMRKEGHGVQYVHSREEGVEAALDGAFDVVFLDVMFPDGSGLDILPRIRAAASLPEVIIITGSGNEDGAKTAIESGAWDYVEKGHSVQSMLLPFVRALQYRTERLARKQTTVAFKREGIVGSGGRLRECLDLAARAANSDTNVLITGETGTGKELFAWAIHKNSARSEGNFVVVDCTALPATLVESMLFGHERGAFTGADRTQVGLFEQADGGTLFLDEVGELPLATQKSFLRVLQERRFRRIGGREEQKSDFRLVTATNRDLEEMAKEGSFRNDLLFRLRGFSLSPPPLRGRLEDIRELALSHVARLCERYGREIKGFSPDFFDALRAYDWPGNVRELVQSMERAVAAAGTDPTLYPHHLPTEIRVKIKRAAIGKAPADESGPGGGNGAGGRSASKGNGGGGSDKKWPEGSFPLLKERLESVEREYLEELMVREGADVKRACLASGLSRTRLYVRLKKFGIARGARNGRD